jgi:hypothetical protein
LPEIILPNVRWYCRYSLSYRDLEEMMAERGVAVDHSTLNRWVLKVAPELDKRIRPFLNPPNDSWRVDETVVSQKNLSTLQKEQLHAKIPALVRHLAHLEIFATQPGLSALAASGIIVLNFEQPRLS